MLLIYLFLMISNCVILWTEVVRRASVGAFPQAIDSQEAGQVWRTQMYTQLDP